MKHKSTFGRSIFVLAAVCTVFCCGHLSHVSRSTSTEPMGSADSIPATVIDKAFKFIASRVGERFCQDNVRFDAGKSEANPTLPAWPLDFAKAHPDLASQPCYRMVFDLAVREHPWVQAKIEFFMNGRGQLLPDIPVRGVPDCASQPAECQFPIDRERAVELAKEAGFEQGLRPWEVSFRWQRSSVTDPLSGTYVWEISNTLFTSPDRDHGTSVVIDANSGEILDHMGWIEGRTLDGR